MANYEFMEKIYRKEDFPSVTVCVTAFNHEKFIKAALLSIISQDYPGYLEIRVGVEPEENTDATINIVKEIADIYDCVKLFELPSDAQHLYNYGAKTGRANFLNTFRGVNTDLVAHLDGDDQYIHPKKLKYQALALMEDSVAIAATSNLLTDRGGEERIMGPKKVEKIALMRLARGQYFHLSTILYRNIYKGSFPFDFFRPETGDYYLSMMYARVGYFVHVPIVGSRYNSHAGGIYSTVSATALEMRMRRNLKKYSTDNEFGEFERLIFKERAERMQVSGPRLKRLFLLRPTLGRGVLIAYKLFRNKISRQG